MYFRIELGSTGYDYNENGAKDFAISAQNFAPYGARFFIDGRRVNLATAVDIASLYL